MRSGTKTDLRVYMESSSDTTWVTIEDKRLEVFEEHRDELLSISTKSFPWPTSATPPRGSAARIWIQVLALLRRFLFFFFFPTRRSPPPDSRPSLKARLSARLGSAHLFRCTPLSTDLELRAHHVFVCISLRLLQLNFISIQPVTHFRLAWRVTPE
ncbi:hypothetical protein B0H14DRAFT_100054 [Mycena olivaceomarginata]|nr:hypothetical protein B0H14DRAFT_100054 [Mycena olivaceomarginata]